MLDEKYFIVLWDIHGVEHCEDITKYHPDEWAKTQLFKAIKTNEVEEHQLNRLVTHLSLRARFNNQRFYECYVFTSCNSMELEDIKEWFNSDPQAFADWVRENHRLKIFDHRTPDHNKRVIS